MSNPSCKLFPQLCLDLDLIEVSGGKFFQISKRKFIDCPLEAKELGEVSPRMFVPFDAGAKYFKGAIMNSFPEDEIHANFLNKFYQCLLARRMPHKVRKLVVYRPKDSGKTSWFQVFLGIIPIQYVASITQEKQFSTSIIKQDTQIVFLDEWSENSLQSDMAKVVLKGGYMPKSKHKDATIVLNNSPYYITTNSLPSFGEEDDNVKRRIKTFEATSLPSTSPNVERWMRKKRHALHCLDC